MRGLRTMLVASHIAAGAAVGLVVERPWQRTLAALGSHLVLDGVGHDDRTIGPVAQGLIGVAALGALTVCWGPTSPVVLGALAGSVPDAEVAVHLAVLGRRVAAHYAFPSHWQIGKRETTEHPYRFPGPGVPVSLELAVAVSGLALICAAGLRHRRRARA
jgi:hypothetical protein